MTVLTSCYSTPSCSRSCTGSPLSCHDRHYLSIGVIVGTVIGLRKALPELEKTVEQLAEAISRHQAIALAAFLIIDVLALAFSRKISLHIYGSKDI